MVKNVATIKGERAITYQILTDFSKYVEWYPECEKCEVISTSGTKVDVNMQLGGMKVARMVLRYDCQPDSSVSYEMVSSPDLKGFTGSYKIVDGEGGQHVVMMEVDLSASVPKFVTDRMMKGSLEKQAAQLQERNKRLSASGAPAAGAAAASAGAAAAGSAAPARPASTRAKRPRCLLRVRKDGAGTAIWYAGAEFHQSKG
jgi:hypothetical protein